jgi:hypothetical protein
LIQIFSRLVFLLDQALVSIHAIGVSLYRLLVSRRHLLRWQNSHEVSKGLKGTLGEFIYLMFFTQLVSALFILIVAKYHYSFYAYFTLILWFISPFWAYQISKKDKVFNYQICKMNLLVLCFNLKLKI